MSLTIRPHGRPSRLALFRECGLLDMTAAVRQAQASFLITLCYFRRKPHLVLGALTSCCGDRTSRLRKEWLEPASALLQAAGFNSPCNLPGELLTMNIDSDKLHRAASEWLKRQCDFRWTTANLPPESAHGQASVLAARPQEALQGDVHVNDPSEQTCGYPITLAPHHQVVAALQTQTLLHGEVPWHADLATRATRRVPAYGSLSLPPHLLRVITSFRLGTTPLSRNVDHDKPISKRICKYCAMLRGEKLVEDDAHAVLDCPLYAQHRVYLFRHMPRTANLRPPASTIQILGRSSRR